MPDEPQFQPALITAATLPKDYASELQRGTVQFRPNWQNYSFHTVVVADGTVLVGCSFVQAAPNTPAIVGKNLAFRECNMVNCAVDPSWTLDRCNTVQSWLLVDADGKHDRVYICGDVKQLTGLEVAPPGAVAITPVQGDV